MNNKPHHQTPLPPLLESFSTAVDIFEQEVEVCVQYEYCPADQENGLEETLDLFAVLLRRRTWRYFETGGRWEFLSVDIIDVLDVSTKDKLTRMAWQQMAAIATESDPDLAPLNWPIAA